MRLYQVLLVMMITAAVAMAVVSSQNDISTETSSHVALDVDKGARRLRSDKIIDAGPTDMEERGVVSSLASKVKRWTKMKYWVHTDKSDDYVQKALGMNGLSGKALKDHPNYKYLQEFWYKLEGRQLGKWLDKDTTTQEAWKTLRLDTIPVGQVKNTDAFRTFVRYVEKYDRKMWVTKGTIEAMPIYFEGSSTEMFVKVKIWARTRMSNRYVKEMLGLDKIPNSALADYSNYKYFLKLVGRAGP